MSVKPTTVSIRTSVRVAKPQAERLGFNTAQSESLEKPTTSAEANQARGVGSLAGPTRLYPLGIAVPVTGRIP